MTNELAGREDCRGRDKSSARVFGETPGQGKPCPYQSVQR